VVTAGELKSGSEPISLSTENCIALIQAIVQYDFWPKGGYLQPAKVTVAGLRLESFPAVATMHKKRALYDRLDFQGTVMSDSGSVPGQQFKVWASRIQIFPKILGLQRAECRGGNDMNASSRHVSGVTVVDMSGRITLGEGGVVLRDTVHDLLDKGDRKILLNLGNITYIDSSGIGELIGAFTAVRKQGGDLKLLNLTKKVHDLLLITKLYTVFDIKDSEAAAISAFNDVPFRAAG
jgi:anti-sigma B factor antagonist